MNKKVLFSIIGIIIVGGAFFGFRMLSSDSESESSNNNNLETKEVKRGSVNSSFSATGIVVSANQVDLNFDNPGELEDLKVTLNEKVEEYQDLASLDPTETKLAWEVLESPIDGTVIYIGGKEGEKISTTGNSTSTTTMAGQIQTSGFITIADLSNLQIEMSIDQNDISKVSKGQKVKITLDAIEDKEFSGKVVSIDPIPANDQNVITYTAHASIDKGASSLRLGMSADIELEYGKKDDILIVPNDAIRNRNGRKMVMTVVDDKVQPVEVQVGKADDNNTEVTEGLKEGDEIISGSFDMQQRSNRGGSMMPFGRGGSRGGSRSFGPPH